MKMSRTAAVHETPLRTKSDDRGVTLIETMVAVLVATIGVLGLGSVIFQATTINKNQGTEKTRATVYAQDKIEKLLSLDFTVCTQPGSSQPASCNVTGVTDTGWTTGLLAGGPLACSQVTGPPAALNCPEASGAAVGYTDFLDANGQQLSGACSAISTGMSYVREWSIADLTPPSGGPALKQITVAVYSEAGVTAEGGRPIVLVTSVLSNPN
jgi:pilin/secretion family protein with methylation motif